MAYTDLTTTFGYKVRINRTDLISLMENDRTLQNFIPYHNRPAIQWLSVNEIRYKANNKSSVDQEADILFHDGFQAKFSQNNPAANDIFDIRRTANWLSPGIQGGLRSGLSEASNTWYAIYAIKTFSGATPITAILVGDTTLPLQVNVATLNTRYGQNNWVYLGMVRNGDNNGVPSDLLNFVMVRNRVYFKNLDTNGIVVNHGTGIRLTTASASTLTYTHSAGTGASDIPDHLKQGLFKVSSGFDSVNQAKDAAENHILIDSGAPGISSQHIQRFWNPVADGVKIIGASAVDRAIRIEAFEDNVLGLGYNALV